MALLRLIAIALRNVTVVLAVLLVLPGLPPYGTFPYLSYDITPTKPLRGVLKPNYELNRAQQLYKGKVYGPETLVIRNNEIYTGTQDGDVVKITPYGVSFVTRIGSSCVKVHEEPCRGRPLGLAFDTLGNNLIIADAYFGLWELDMETFQKKILVSRFELLPGVVERRARLFNSIAVDRQGIIYWTDSSSDYSHRKSLYAMFLNPSGRYDRATNKSYVLIDGLVYANGIVLSPNEDFIVVAETGAMRLRKHYLKGPNAGKTEVFVDGLPGHPDNLTPEGDTIWVPLVVTADKENPSPIGTISRHNWIRLFAARLMGLAEIFFLLCDQLFPSEFAKLMTHRIANAEVFTEFAPERSTIVRVDWNGNILNALHGFDKSTGFVSHVLPYQDELLLGSPYNDFLGRVRYFAHQRQIVRNPKVKTATPAGSSVPTEYKKVNQKRNDVGADIEKKSANVQFNDGKHKTSEIKASTKDHKKIPFTENGAIFKRENEYGLVDEDQETQSENQPPVAVSNETVEIEGPGDATGHIHDELPLLQEG